MPGPARWMSAEVVKKALENGSLTESALDDKVRRLLGVLEKAGLLENPAPLQEERGEDRPEHRARMREAAARGDCPASRTRAFCRSAMSNPSLSLAARGARQHSGRRQFRRRTRITPSPRWQGFAHARGCRAGRDDARLFHPQNPACAFAWDADHARRSARLRVSIFDNADLSGAPVFTIETTSVHHGWWGGGIPNITDQSVFSARMEGFFTPQESGLHTLGLNVTGRARLYLDDRLVIDHWGRQESGQQKNAELALEAGRALRAAGGLRLAGRPLLARVDARSPAAPCPRPAGRGRGTGAPL